MNLKYIDPLDCLHSSDPLLDIRWIPTCNLSDRLKNGSFCPVRFYGKNCRMASVDELLQLKGLIEEGINYIVSGGKYQLIDLEEPVIRTEEQVKSKTPSFVYLMRNNSNGLTKIGWSKNPRFREKTLRSEEPDIELIFNYQGSRKQEQSLHTIFTTQRVRGEWFNLSDEDINTCKAYLISGAI